MSLQPSKHFDLYYFISVFQQNYDVSQELPTYFTGKERDLEKLVNWYKVHC